MCVCVGGVFRYIDGQHERGCRLQLFWHLQRMQSQTHTHTGRTPGNRHEATSVEEFCQSPLPRQKVAVVALTSKIDCHVGLSEVAEEEEATAVRKRQSRRRRRCSRQRRGERDD